MKKILLYIASAVFAVSSFNVCAQDSQSPRKDEPKTKKVKMKHKDAASSSKPVYDKRVNADDPSKAKSKPTKKIKPLKIIRNTPDEPKELKPIQKQRRERASDNGIN